MIKNRIFLIVLFVFIFVGAAHQIIFSQTPLKEVPELLATMRAKEFCSCYYLLDKGEDYCLESVKKGYPVFEFKIDKNQKSITFTNPVASAKAVVNNRKYGCELY